MSEMSKELLEKNRRLIADGAIDDALEQISNVLHAQQNTSLASTASFRELRQEALGHLASLRGIAKAQRSGLLPAGEARAERARISLGTLQLLDEFERMLADSDARLPADITIALPPVSTGRIDVTKLEKIWGRSKLKSLSWLHRGLSCAKSVCRVASPTGLGSGFLIRSGALVTNNHVLPTADAASQALVEFNYEEDLGGNLLPITTYRLEPESFQTDPQLDCSIVRIRPESDSPLIDRWGFLSLTVRKKANVGDYVTIIQHPEGGVKQICLTGNHVVNIYDDFLQYMTDTLPGSSGSPVFDEDWNVLAIHQAGGALQKNATGDYIFANQGILIESIFKSSNFKPFLHG